VRRPAPTPARSQRLNAGPGSTRAASQQRRQAAAHHTLPRLLTAPSDSRSVWSAPACWRCRRAALRPETSHPAPAFHKRPDGLLTRLDCPFEGRVPPRPDGNDSMKEPGSTRAKKRRGRYPSIRRGETRPSNAGRHGSCPSIGRHARFGADLSAMPCFWKVGFHPGRETLPKQPIPTME